MRRPRGLESWLNNTTNAKKETNPTKIISLIETSKSVRQHNLRTHGTEQENRVEVRI